MKSKLKVGRISAILILLITVFLSVSPMASAVTYVDGNSNSYTAGSGSKLTGNQYNVLFTDDAIVGYRFSLMSKNSSGSYYQVKGTDVFYSGSNTYPSANYNHHLKVTAGGTTYRNLSKFAYNNLYSSITKVEAEAYSNSSYSKYTGTASSLGTTITDSAESMKTWCKTATKMNLVLAKFGSYKMADLKDSDRIFVEPLYSVRINGTGYTITVTEMALLGRIFFGDSSTGYEGAGKGYDWLTICNYTNRYYASEMYTSDSSHCGISVGSALTSRATFKNIFTKGYGLYVVRCEIPHTLTVYYKTGTGASSLTIGSGYKLASNFSSYSSSYIRNTDNEYYTQSVKYDNSLTLSSGFGMKRNYYTFSKWKDADSSNTFASGATKTASQLKSSVATGNAELTLDAVWTPVSYTITYDLNGGKIGTSTTNPKQTYNYETDVYIGNYSSGATAYTVPAKTGYVFAGWKHIGTAVGYWGKDTVYENKYNKGKSEHGDITLTAQWNPITYTVKYYLDGTEQTSLTQTCKYGSSYTYKELPSKTGYAVSGWNSKSDMTGTSYTVGNSFSNLTMTDGGTIKRYAKSTANSYTVEYYLDGTKQISLTQTCKYGSSYSYKALPSKTGYTVAGWNSKADISGTAYSAGGSFKNLTSTAGKVIKRYASSTVNSYTITYKWTDGETITGLNPTLYVYGKGATLPAVPSCAGYSVGKDWLTSATGAATAKTISSTATGNKTFYAKRTVLSYSVTYDANGGSGVPAAQTKIYNVALTLSSTKPTRTGYSFVKWNTKSDGTGTEYDPSASYSANADLKLYAQWMPNKYTVKYYLDGIEQTGLAQKCTYGTSYSYKSLPTKTGYTVSGWNSKADMASTAYTPGGSFTNLTSTNNGTVSRYATSKVNSYTITYKWADTGVAITGLTPTSYTYGIGATLPAVPSLSGYNMDSHWFTTATGTTTATTVSTTATGNKTFYAKRTAIGYTVTYNANGGTGAPDSQAKAYNVALTLASGKPTRTGYTFKIWNTKSDGTGTDYKPASSYSSNADLTLYAQWTSNTYTVEYYLDDILQIDITQTCKYGTSYKYASVPLKTGYSVTGWNSKSDQTGTVYTSNGSFSNLTSVNNDVIKRYASSKPNIYTVNYYLDGMLQGGLTQTCTYDTMYYYAALPSKTGYVITGWNANADMSGLSYSDGASFRNLSSTNNGTVKCYAQSVPITYQVKYNGNGSTSGSMTKSSHNYDMAKNLTTNAYKRVFTVMYNYNGNGMVSDSATASAKFNGWAKSSTGSVTYTDEQSVKNLSATNGAVVNVYAKWTDTSVTLPSPTRTGYILSGLYTASSGGTKVGNGGDSYTPSADITVYARWTPITYTIRFDGNGSTGGSTASMNMTYDVAAKLTENGFIRSGYEFVCWNTKADGTGTTYNDMQTVKNLTAVQSKVITLYAVWKPVRVLSLEPVIPNAAYREGTDVITSFYIVNAGLADCVPGDNISVKFTVYKGSTAIKTLTMNNVVVPKNDKNLLFFKWTVPALSGSIIKITGEIIENGENYGLVSRNYETCTNVISATPDTQYEASAPAGFSAPSKLTEKSETVNWSVWIYENNAFVKKTYGYGLKNVTAAITPDPDSHSTLTGSTWTMKSGYGYSLSASGSGAAASGYLTPDSTAYTAIQYAYALFPEFGYSSSVNSFRTLELRSGKWIFRTNGSYGRIHFTPLWYPDGNYTASVVLSDCWTPAGMITAVKNSNNVVISGSAYDDWFID